MTDIDFNNLYWKQFLMIEKEFRSTIKYVALDKNNFVTYSDFFAKILLQIGSEVDTIAKELCTTINPGSSVKNINDYKNEITGRFSEFPNVIVSCKGIDLNPWNSFPVDSPDWWKIYNGVKHNRNEIKQYNNISQPNYKFANLENTLKGLAGLYQEELYLYSLVHHDANIETPMPGSLLFTLKGFGWENKRYFSDFNLFVDKSNGCLIYQTSDFLYNEI